MPLSKRSKGKGRGTFLAMRKTYGNDSVPDHLMKTGKKNKKMYLVQRG